MLPDFSAEIFNTSSYSYTATFPAILFLFLHARNTAIITKHDRNTPNTNAPVTPTTSMTVDSGAVEVLVDGEVSETETETKVVVAFEMLELIDVDEMKLGDGEELLRYN